MYVLHFYYINYDAGVYVRTCYNTRENFYFHKINLSSLSLNCALDG